MTDRSFIGQLEDTWTATAAVGRDLDAGEWDLPTDCPGWTVRDQLSHLVGAELMLSGRPAPDPAPPGLPHVRNPIGEMNEAWVEARRGVPGAQVLAEFEEVTAHRLEQLRAMTDEELAVVGPSPVGPAPYATFMDVRVMDSWVHEQDIRRAVNRPGHLDGPAAEAAVTRLLGSFGYVVGKRVAPPDGSTVLLELTGPVARWVAVEMQGGRATALADRPEAPTAWIVTDSETFVELVTGRSAAEGKIEAQRAAVHGDEAIGRAVLANLPTIP
jgi:uncharacterized protein (TIGR03083 family)